MWTGSGWDSKRISAPGALADHRGEAILAVGAASRLADESVDGLLLIAHIAHTKLGAVYGLCIQGFLIRPRQVEHRNHLGRGWLARCGSDTGMPDGVLQQRRVSAGADRGVW